MTYKVGIGMYDSTGPAAEQVMLGYGDSKQKTKGICDRQWIRAFIIKDEQDNYICLAVADICMFFQAVKDEVLKRISHKFGGVLKTENIMLSATHTHSGPGGYACLYAFDMYCKGFNKETFEVIVNGFVQAIERAWKNMKDANIYFNKDKLLDCGGQRSREAWESNPKEEKAKYGDTDKEFLMLRIIDTSKKLIGLICYFAMHNTSMGANNYLISSDNRGVASRLLERKFGNDPYKEDPGFIAAFPNSNGADVSPNVGLGIPKGGEEDIKRMIIFGKKLYQKALSLLKIEAEEIKGNIKFGQTNIDISNILIEGTNRRTCDAAIGASMTGASSEDSASPMPLFVEGLTKSEFLEEKVSRKHSFIRKWLTFVLDFFWQDMDDPEWVEAQGEKPILLPIGRMSYRKLPFFPKIFPIQIFKLGFFCIIGFPGEITSIAGIRLKNTVLDAFKNTEVKYCTINGYSNSYLNYTTTKEEYSQQHYEGANTLFGPDQLEAFQQEYRKLVGKIKQNEKIDPGLKLQDFRAQSKKYRKRVLFDDDKLGKDFGDVLKQPDSIYSCGDRVEVEFVGGHPRNNFRTMDTFLEVQRKSNDKWITVYRDLDFETQYHWERKMIAQSLITIIWQIPQDEKPGEYQIIHKGDAKTGWPRRIHPYSGISNSFQVVRKS